MCRSPLDDDTWSRTVLLLTTHCPRASIRLSFASSRFGEDFLQDTERSAASGSISLSYENNQFEIWHKPAQYRLVDEHSPKLKPLSLLRLIDTVIPSPGGLYLDQRLEG